MKAQLTNLKYTLYNFIYKEMGMGMEMKARKMRGTLTLTRRIRTPVSRKMTIEAKSLSSEINEGGGGAHVESTEIVQ
jgi:hypothetical protein